jgi:solute carrier family 8 (sodium/calcium exchanger)
MAFGSSAPEIILSVLDAVTTLGEPAGELGPSTIVGSAAFNLLVISGVSVLAVGGEGTDTKKVDDMGVFVTTGTFSIFAYIWLYVCLTVNSPDEVTITEAVLTFSYFIVLLVLAFAADKYNQRKKAKVDNEKTLKENLRKMKKSHLRSMARTKGEMAILSAAQG